MSMYIYQPIENIWFYLFVIGAFIGLATYTWQFRQTPGAKPQVYGQICKGVWMLSMVMCSLNGNLSEKICWLAISHISSLLMPFFWFSLIWELSHQRKSIPKAVKYGYLGLAGCLSLVIMTNFWHGLYWQEISLEGNAIRVVSGLVRQAGIIIAYFLSALTIVQIVRWLMGSAGLCRKQAVWYTLSSIVALGGTVLDFVPALGRIAPLPMGFLLSGVFITWGFYRWHSYNILFLAQEVVAQNMIDGLLVVDEYGYIVDLNPTAQMALTGLPVTVGSKLAELVVAWPILAKINETSARHMLEVVREQPEGKRYYQLYVTSLQTRDYRLGMVMILKDITQQKQDQAYIIEQEKVLSILTERNRLSRELHDTDHGQFPGYVKTQAQAVGLLLKKDRLLEATGQLNQLVQAAEYAFADVRESISALKNTATEWNFFRNLEEYLQRFQQTSDLTITYSGPQMVSSNWILQEAEVQLLRIIQEILTNIRKHAGASRIEVEINVDDVQMNLVIVDDGCGFDLGKTQSGLSGFGLKIMQERVAEIDGICLIKPLLDKGTAITIAIPLSTEALKIGMQEDGAL